MYQLFQAQIRALGASILFPEFNHAQLGLQRSVQQVITYHENNPHGLNGSHFLVKLLGSLNVPLSMPYDIYNDKVTDQALNLAMSLKMTSALSKGHVFDPGVFFGPDIREILIATIDSYDTSLLKDQWHTLRPIEVLYHPKTELNLALPDGKHHSVEGGYAVITINIPMLASQYRMWREYDRRANPDAPRSVMQFLTMFPLPNMLYSYLDWAIVNRTIHKFFDLDLPKVKNPNPFYLTDYSAEVDKTLTHYLQAVETNGWNFDMMLNALPQLSSRSTVRDLIQPPAMAFSQQLQWAIVMARLPLISFLVQLNFSTDNQRNQSYLNTIRRWLRQFDLNRTLKALPPDMYDEAMVFIERGILPYLT
jgi:hypothetical protein